MKVVKQQERSINTINAIVESVIELSKERPLNEISVSEICVNAGVSIGSFYHHFTSKESLIPKFYSIWEDTFREDWEKQSFENPLDAVKYLVVKQLQGVSYQGYEFGSQFMQYHLSRNTEEDIGMLSNNSFLFRTLQEEIEKLMKKKGVDGLPSEVVVHDVLTGNRGVIFDWCMRHGSYDHVKDGLRSLSMVLQYYGLLD